MSKFSQSFNCSMLVLPLFVSSRAYKHNNYYIYPPSALHVNLVKSGFLCEKYLICFSWVNGSLSIDLLLSLQFRSAVFCHMPPSCDDHQSKSNAINILIFNSSLLIPALRTVHNWFICGYFVVDMDRYSADNVFSLVAN